MQEERDPMQPLLRTYTKTIKIGGRERTGIYYEVTQKRKLSGDDQFSLEIQSLLPAAALRTPHNELLLFGMAAMYAWKAPISRLECG